MPVCGIDPSLTATAVFVLDDDGAPLQQFVRSSDPQPGVAGRVLRCYGVAACIETNLEIERPSVVCIEGYSMGSNMAQHSTIVEYGYELRRMLCGLDWHPRVIEVPPATLKKFCTGKGNSDKSAIASHLTDRYGVRFDSNDEADAYGLARIALCVAGHAEPTNQAQRDSLAKLTAGPVKKTRKRKVEA